MMLRAEYLESMELTEMLERCAKKMLEGGSVRVEVARTGDSRTIPLRLKDTLFRIGQEALANSVRHAIPGCISISVLYADNSVRLAIEDDGIGYDKRSEQKGFGVRGMRRHAAAISAHMEIASSQDQGTRVSVTASLPKRMSFQSWLTHFWRRIRGLSTE